MDPSQSLSQEPPQINIVDVPVTDETVSLNLMVQFLNIAQRRGAFSIAESAKIFECIRIFIHPSQFQPPENIITELNEPEPETESNAETVDEEGEVELKE